MIRIILAVLFMTIVQFSVKAQQLTGWDKLEKVKFAKQYHPVAKWDLLMPVMDEYAKSLQSKEITLKGYAIPLDLEANFLVISKFPYKMCFFCGNAGPDSVVEIYFKDKKDFSKYPMDKLIVVKGKLIINNNDLEKLNFILESAQEVN